VARGLPKLVSETSIFQGRIFQVAVEEYQLSENQVVRWEVVRHPGSVVIVPVDQRGRVLLLRQYRPAVREELLELPAGTLSAREPPLACAQRELREETGYRAESLKPIGGFFAAPGFCTEYLHCFLATGLVKDPLPGDEDEVIRVTPTGIASVLRLLKQGDIHDAKTMAGLLLYLQFYRKRAGRRDLG
jgi:ADP-ribose pyrophosphatase